MKIERFEFFSKRDVHNFFYTDIAAASHTRTCLRGVSPNVKGLPTRKTRLIRRNLKMDFSSSKLARTPYFILYFFGFNVNSPTHELLAQFNRYPPPPNALMYVFAL